MDLRVLYEDNHLIAVNKPSGIMVQRDKKNNPCLMDFVKEYLKEKYHKPGNVFLGLLHRLDTPVSGIILFAKTSKGSSRLSAQFRKNEVKKTYYAIVEGQVKDKKKTLIDYLLKDKIKNIVSVFPENVSGAKKAELSFETLKSNKIYSLLKINLKTGRPHQIRAQLSAFGHPILGDKKYQAKKKYKKGEIALISAEMSFKSATKDQNQTIKIALPKTWDEIFIKQCF